MWRARVLSFLLLFMVADLEAFTQNHLLIPSQVLFQKKTAKSRLGTILFSVPPPQKQETATAERTMPSSRNGVRNKKGRPRKKRKPKRKEGEQAIANSFYSEGEYQTLSNGIPITIGSHSVTPSELIPTRSNSSDLFLCDNDKAEEEAQHQDIDIQEAIAREPIRPLQGDLPDVFWRAIPMEHIRLHPYFIPLAPTHKVNTQQNKDLTLEHAARQYRQGSWQWDTLHLGRCTTSSAAAALGFLENIAGQVLGVPASWRRTGAARGAFVRMRHPPAIRTLQDLKRVFATSPEDDGSKTSIGRSTRGVEQVGTENVIWTRDENAKYAAIYNGTPLTKQELQQRRAIARKFTQSDQVTKALRMSWGNTQEATSLLTALNYFVQREGTEFRLQEVGMCGAGLELNQTSTESSLLVGASPDGVLVFPDGRIEALEVKNHCPFVTPFVKKGRRRSGKRFFIRDQPLDDTVFPHYVPQLQLEMFCLGQCQAAVMVRQTATRGALFLRMQRDDAWIQEMLHFLHRFQREFVERNIPPPPNFFWLDDDRKEQSRYRDFVNRTMELRKSVKVVATVSADEIQRSDSVSPLFLDGK